MRVPGHHAARSLEYPSLFRREDFAVAQIISSPSATAGTAGECIRQSEVTALPGTPENPLHTIFTIPNLITLGRLLLTIAFLFMFPHETLRTPAIIIFIIAASTDWFDGQVARKFRQVSVFGKRFDPVMDRLLIFSGVAALILGNLVPIWVVAFLVLRDLYLLIGGFILRKRCEVTIDVCYVGKMCTFVLMAGFAVVLLGLFPVPGLNLLDVAWLPGFGIAPTSLGMWAIYVGCALSFSAAVIYTARGIRALINHR